MDWRQVFLYAGPEDQSQEQDQVAEQTPERRAALEKDAVVGVRRRLQLTAARRDTPGGARSVRVWFRELLPELARTYGVQFISDAYWTSSPQVHDPLPTGEPTALFTLLDRQVGSTHQWEHEGKLVRLRSRTWFFDRPREVPLRLVRRWKEIGEREGALPLDEYVAMATGLTDAQLGSLDALEAEARLPSGSVEVLGVQMARHGLRLYASLTPAQRQTLAGGKPVPVTEMPPPARELFLAGLKEVQRHQYQPLPLDLRQWAAGAFALTSERMTVRTVREDGLPITLLEPAPRAAASKPPASPAPRPGGAPPVKGSAVPRLVNRVRFEFSYGPGLRQSANLMVAAAP